LDDLPHPPLLTAYLERREDMLRYFRARLRSEEAARDLVQDLYLKVLASPQEDILNPAAYLYRLGSNLMLDRLKQQKRSMRRDTEWRVGQTSSLGDFDIAQITPADDALDARQRLARIVAVVESLPAPVRQAFRLHKLEGLSHAETSTAMGVSRSSVEKYIMTSLACILEKVGRGDAM
jgi:RNA polymerase sigma factor (sigma-70 family)